MAHINLRRTPLLLVFCLTITSPQLSFSQSKAEGLDAGGLPSWLRQAKPEANDLSTPQIRKIRSDSYNLPQAVALDSKPGTFNLSGYGNYSRQTPLPVEQADAVISASAISNQPFLSTDHARVYSELYVVPTEIIKNYEMEIQLQKPITILQEGGTLRTSRGQLLTALPMTGSKPMRLNNSYLLFLKYNRTTETYSVIHYWDTSKPVPIELDREGHPLTQQIARDQAAISTTAQLILAARNKVVTK